jgi:hypothetical protein
LTRVQDFDVQEHFAYLDRDHLPAMYLNLDTGIAALAFCVTG